MPSDFAPIYRLRVSLVDSDPEIWRLIEVRGDLTLADLHHVIQVSIGWHNSHLHDFALPDGRRWTDLVTVDEPAGELDESLVTVAEVLSETSGPLAYVYDLGDSWNHVIELIEIITDAPPTDPSARLIGGAERGPWEDSGGIHGYAEKVAILADPGHEDHELIRGWTDGAAGPWRPPPLPDGVDSSYINTALAYLFSPETITTHWNEELKAAVGRLPGGAGGEFAAYLSRADLDGPSLAPPSELAEIVRPYAWLLDHVGTEGVRLTQAGWMPPALVRAAMDELDWDQPWMPRSKGESHLPPVRALRDSATRLGLIRKAKGMLLLTQAGQRLRTDPGGLWVHLAQRWFRAERAGVERDTAVLFAAELAVGVQRTIDEVLDGVAYGLNVMGGAGADGYSSLTSEDAWFLVNDVNDVLQTLGLDRASWRDPKGPRFDPRARDFARQALTAP